LKRYLSKRVNLLKLKEKSIIGCILSVLFLFIILSGANAEANSEVITNKDKAGEKIILIDPGHGGIDGGAVAKDHTLEKNINLAISLKLKAALEKEGYKVVMTRQEDKGLYTDSGRIRKKHLEDLAKRCELIKTSNCNLFISIHLNAFPQTQYHGAQVWYAGNDESRMFANIMQMNFKEDLDNNNNRKSKAGGKSYLLLKDVGERPAVIAECGFVSNIEELGRLKDSSYQQKIAESILKSVNQYYKRN
jgi:N-acetylmuramoyl-L-alanine amidase